MSKQKNTKLLNTFLKFYQSVKKPLYLKLIHFNIYLVFINEIKKMLSQKLIYQKIENFKYELAQDYLSFFYNPSYKNQHFKEIINLIHYRYFKEFPLLTEQEKQCLYLAGQGKTIIETARLLNIQFDTAREYRELSIKKMSSKNITEAAVKYYHKS